MKAPDKKKLPLFNEQDLDAIQPTGSSWVIDPDNPATVPVPLQTVIVDIDGPYTERDRKLWVFLLHAVFDELGETPLHSLKIRDINRVFREAGGEHDTKWLWESAKRLAKTTVEWKTTFDDARFEQGIAAIFGANISRKAKRDGTLTFFFPPTLIPIIKQPMRFARLRVHFLLSLSGKYAVTLYELLEGFANRRDGELRVPLDDLRTWLKVPEGSYLVWKDFRKRVLEPAVKQINADPLGAGFSVSYDPIRRGRFYEAVVFTIDKNAARKEIEASLKGKAKPHAKRPALDPDTYDKARKAAAGLDVYMLESEFWEWWEGKGCPPFEKNADAAFIGFCRKRGKEAA